MENWVKDLKFVLMPARYQVKGYEREYNAVYHVWKTAWTKFRSEIGVKEPLSSDGFFLPDEVGAVFYQNECVGFSSFTFGDYNGPLQDLAWFKPWTPEAMKELSNISTDIMICSQFTVNPKFAGKGHVVRWKEIVFIYALLRFENSPAGVMAGHLNLTRGMQNAGGEGIGGTVLNACHPFNYYGVEIPAQLMAYERHKFQAKKQEKQIVGLCDDLWSRLIHISELPVEKKILPFKKVA